MNLFLELIFSNCWSLDETVYCVKIFFSASLFEIGRGSSFEDHSPSCSNPQNWLCARNCHKKKKSTVPDDFVSVDDVFLLAETKTSFFQNLQRNFNEESITCIENMTSGQSSNDAWYNFRRSVITASKCHKVLTKVKKLKNGAANVSTFTLNQ